MPDNAVAVDAVLALPFNEAVIVPALKLPLASLATTLFAVFAVSASTSSVTAYAPGYSVLPLPSK